MKKIYTCTPVAFHANEGFHIRDTGLIAAGLRALGVESKCIMPLPQYEDDLDLPLIRTEYTNLSDPNWWKSLGLDGVIMYSWGCRKYISIVRAVKKAGIPLCVHLDTSASFLDKKFDGSFSSLRNRLANITRSIHLSYADVVTIAQPAYERLMQNVLLRWAVRNKGLSMPNPVSPACIYDGRTKENKIIAIGRWDDIKQKRPAFLMETLEKLYRSGCDYITEIYGKITSELETWHRSLPASIAEKVHLKGYVSNVELIKNVYNNAKILVCSSMYEGSHIVSCEALCCGCSVVTTNRPSDLRDVIWYTTRQSGEVAEEDTPQSLAEAIAKEIHNWEAGKRNPDAISNAWKKQFHTDQVLPVIMQRFEEIKK